MKTKTTLISGASAGIGAATAIQLAQKNYPLILLARRKEKLESLRQQILQESPLKPDQVQIFELDVRDSEAVTQFSHQNKTELAEVQILINNAGLAAGVEKMQDANAVDWDLMIDTNVKGLLYLTRQILPIMVQKNSGHIVNLGSVAGRWTYPGGGVYCATKFAVRALSEGLRMDLLGKNIRVTNIEPGMVESEFSIVRLGSKEKANAVYQGMNPLTPKDIAETIVWTLERPAHVNIQELVIYPTDQAHVGQVHRTQTKGPQ